ncbi:response regulator [Paenibacillus sp. LHD-117]|uniref:response regulator transcription factor n=1 Tax=Paenibacillus sp. LHD-117 TaxID=3071412 RepID=UPI0027E1DAAE|nr:response regulator [Paenibacillus sp. LHD-117]MDQ6418298.1 response regulator [Paenibacillus sp. LHD-117]
MIIIDDEMIVRHAVKTLVRWENSWFEYAGSASSGVSALELVEQMNADIVITDIKMLEMDGLELIKRLMKGKFDDEILVLSNYNDFELVREVLKLGVHDYMLKLTLKTESFMQTLDEIASKLDDRRSASFRPIAAAPSLEGGYRDRMSRQLEEIDQDNVSFLIHEQAEAAMAGPDVCYYSFIVRCQGEIARTEELRDMLEKLADGLLPGSRLRAAVQRDPERALLVIGCHASQAVAAPQEITCKLGSLSDMYYNVPLVIVYARIAVGLAELAAEISASRETEAGLLHSRAGTNAACIPNRDATEEKASKPEAVYRKEVRQAVAYLEKHYTERISIADIAGQVGLSEPYLCQIFKAETNSSIVTRLNDIRMEKAFELLGTGRYLVKQAAIEVGISDPFYFNRLFKKRFGISPKNAIRT